MKDFTNYYEHPGNPNYMVFRFRDTTYAERFEIRLNEKAIPFEKDISTNENQVITTLYGVKKTYYKEALNQNFLTFSELRKPFISDPILRYFILLITILCLTLSLIGYFLS